MKPKEEGQTTFGQASNKEAQTADGEERKTIEVAAAIIHRQNIFLSTQRGYGEFAGQWEFPGGKIEPGETVIEALRREIDEELSIAISPERFFCIVNYDYPTFHLTMHCYQCRIIDDGAIKLREHKSAKWLTPEQLDSVAWLPADRIVVSKLKQELLLKATEQACK